MLFEPLPRQRVNAAGLRDPGTPEFEERRCHPRVTLPFFDCCNRRPSPSTLTNEHLPAPYALFTRKVAHRARVELHRFPGSCSKHQHSNRPQATQQAAHAARQLTSDLDISCHGLGRATLECDEGKPSPA